MQELFNKDDLSCACIDLGTRREDMAPKPEPNRLAFVFGMVLAIVVTVLAITAWAQQDWAAPIPPTETIYGPQHLNLF